MHKRILIVVPTYNESGNIFPLVKAIDAIFAGHTAVRAEILFLDDGSADGTREQITSLQRRRTGVHVLDGHRFGLGKAYIRGLRHAQTLGGFFAIVTMDADLSHDPKYILPMLTTLEQGNDLVLASRYMPGGGNGPEYSYYRLFLSRLANRLVGTYAPVTDRTSGFRAITPAALSRLPLHKFTATGYFFAAEFIHAAHHQGLKIAETPIIFQARSHGRSKLRTRDMLEFAQLAYRYNPLTSVERAVVDFTALFLLFLAVSTTRLDPDFGWHLTAGNYVLAHGLPGHDIYTYTARSFRWINHEWGNDVVLALLYRTGGYNLASLLYAGLWAGAVYIAGSGRAKLLTLLLAGVAITDYAGNRPLAWTVFFFSLVLAILKGHDRRWRLLLPLIFLIWANVHAGFIAGLALIGYYLIFERRLKTLALLLASFAATFINGYGPRIYSEVLRTVSDPNIHARIQEWNRFYLPATAWIFAGLWLLGFIIYRPRRPQKSLRHWLGLPPILMAASLSATRNLPLFTVSAVSDVDRTIAHLKNSAKKLNPRGQKIVLALSAFLLLVLSAAAVVLYAPPLVDRTGSYPSRAVSYLQTTPCSGNLFNSFIYGGYLIWKLPGRPVYIDGRMPTWEPYMTNYINVTTRPSKYADTEFQRYNIRCALLMSGLDKPLINHLIAAHWTTVVNANGSRLLIAPKPSLVKK